LYVDRHQDIVEMYNRDWLDWTDDYEIPTDIFSISIMLAQLVRYDGIIKETKFNRNEKEEDTEIQIKGL